MARVQRLAGQMKFGELDEVTVYYDETTDRWVVQDKKVTNRGAEVGIDLVPTALTQNQPFTVNVEAALECPVKRVVIPSGVDTVQPAGAGATDHVGVAQETIGVGSRGQIAVAGVVTLDCTNACNVGDYLVTAANGQVTAQAALPAAGTLVGIARSSTVGAGEVRAFLRMGAY